MFRLVPALATALAALSISSAALGADYGDGGLRGSLPSNWGDMSDAGDPLEFEFGVRYNYSMGNRSMVENGNSYQINDSTHTIEAYGRIDDFSTGAYLKGHAGYSAIYEGDNTTPLTVISRPVDSGRLAYVTADFGYLSYGDGDLNWGPFIGYHYSGTQSTVGIVNESVTVDMHIARLGVAARGEVGDGVGLSAEVALVPYSLQSGSAQNGDNFNANLFGAQGEVSIDFQPYDSFVVSLGARASYLTDDFGAAGTDHSTDFRAGGFLGIGYRY